MRQSTRIPRTCAHCGVSFLVKPSQVIRGNGKFCSLDCRGQSMYAPPEMRFWKYVKKTDTCWVWIGSRNKKGYGRIGTSNGKSMLAHRLSFEMYYNLVPDGLFVLHDCPGGDNPSCVNPDHLWLGTPKDNSADAVQKGWKNRGERHSRAKLTESNVIDIRSRFSNGSATGVELAREYGVHPVYISELVHRRYWKHI